MTNLLLQSVQVLDPASKREEIADLAIRDGMILHPDADTTGLPVVNCQGLLAAPGFWDAHVHFRDPGHSAAETRETGAKSAAAGGFTHVVTMPNTNPPGDSVAWVREQIEDTSLAVKILPSACVSKGRHGRELADLRELATAGAVAFTDDGAMVSDEAIMREAMLLARELDKPIMDHAVLPAIAGRGMVRECAVAQRYGLALFPPEAEVEAVVQDIRLCRETGCSTHIQHISCAESVEAVRKARAAGLPVSGEATPHHLALSAQDIPGDDGNYRMNPPLGNREDVIAIRQAILDGTLSMFATDHAPHTPATKEHGFARAAFGVVGLETAIGVTWRVMVEECGMPVMEWVSRWTLAPARLLRQPPPGLSPGSVADLVLIDTRRSWRVVPSTFLSLSRNTPFAGWELRARPVLTVCQGRITSRGID